MIVDVVGFAAFSTFSLLRLISRTESNVVSNRPAAVMNEKSSEREEQCEPRKSMSLPSCHGEALYCSEMCAEGNEARYTNRDRYSWRYSHTQRTVHVHHSTQYQDENGSSEVVWTNSTGTGVSLDEEFYHLSMPVSSHSAQSLSSYCCRFPQNGSSLEADRQRIPVSCVNENGLTDANHVQPHESSGSSAGSRDTLPSVARSFRGNSTDQVMFKIFQPEVESTACSAIAAEMPGQNAEGEQTDAGYMEELDAFLECTDSPAAHGHGGARVGVNAGVHFSFEMDAGAAGGGAVEDVGDFIDADIPRNCNGSSQFSSRSNDSVTSSFEELAAGATMSDSGQTEKDDSDSSKSGIVSRPCTWLSQDARKRLSNCPVNNLSLVGKTSAASADLPQDFVVVPCDLQNPFLSQSGSMNFGKEVTSSQGKLWRWSDGDVVGNLLNSMAAAASLTSDSSYGAPSAPVMSPLSLEDDVLVSALSSPDTLYQLQAKVNQCSHGSECLVNSKNLSGPNVGKDGRWLPASLELNSDSFLNCGSCSSLLENMNQSAPKHLLEKYLGVEMEASSSTSPSFWTRCYPSGTKVKGPLPQAAGELSPSNTSCSQCRSERHRMGNGFNGTGISNAEVPLLPSRAAFDVHLTERCLKSLPSDESVRQKKSRRFSCQNLIGSESLEFSASSSGESHHWDRDALVITSALSEDSLHSTQLLKRRPFSLHLNCNGNAECMEGCHLVTSGRGISHPEAKKLQWKMAPNHGEEKKILPEASSVSPSTVEKGDEEGVEKTTEKRAHHLTQLRNNNSHRLVCVGDQDLFYDSSSCDKNLPWREDGAVRSNVTMFCGACPVFGLLRLLGVTDVSRRVCDMLPGNGPLEKASLPEYLLSCSTAGIPAEQLISRVTRMTKDLVYGKFFHLCPQKNVNLIHWLKYWTRNGAVLLATLKCQIQDSSGDFWHHKILHSAWVEGLGDSIATEDDFPAAWFASDSSIRIPRQNIITRWHDDCDLNILVSLTDTRWHQMNVLGQVVNILREERLQTVSGYRPQQTSHVIIPTHFRSGITLYVRTDSSCFAELRGTVADLPPMDQLNGKVDESMRKFVMSPQEKNQQRKKEAATGIRETVIF